MAEAEFAKAPEREPDRANAPPSGSGGGAIAVAEPRSASSLVGNLAMRRAFGGAQGVGRPDDPAEEAADRLADRALTRASGRPGPGGGNRSPQPVLAALGSSVGLGARDVRLHDDPGTAAAARSVHARAFALGSDIGFAAGAYRPGTPAGRRLIAHELAHVALGHSGVRRELDSNYEARYEAAERRRIAEEARERQHQAWAGSVDRAFGRDLHNQSKTFAEERERLDLAVTSQQAAALDAAASGQGWLLAELRTQGYAGPTLPELKQSWGEALVAADALRFTTSTDASAADAQLGALGSIPTFYVGAASFVRAAEEAHRRRAEEENGRRAARYRTQLEAYEQREQLDRMSQGPIGEPGERAARAGQAWARGPRPEPPTLIVPPPAVSVDMEAARGRVIAAQTADDWTVVARDVARTGTAFARLVIASLPDDSDVRKGVEYLEQLQTRTAAYEEANPLAVRIPAMFYPKDRTIKQKGPEGQELLAPESIPWQFYLSNTGVTTHDQPARSGGEWVLRDLTSGQPFQNRAPARDFDSARLQQGEAVDPPIEMFSQLNTKIRFPEGRLYFTLPSGTSYVLETTEPWSWSEFLTAVGIALAAIALVASVVATGGASAPAAVAFYAGVGAVAAGVGSTLADLHEKSQQGILTSEDVDAAMISIGIDILTAVTMGLGRLVAVPRAAARLGFTGERFLALQRITQVGRQAVLAADVYQAWSLTRGVIAALDAIERQPNLSPAERNRLRGQIVRRALVAGTIMVIAIRGDYHDVQAGRTVRVTVEPDGAIAAVREEVGAHPEAESVHPHEDVPSGGAHVAPHAEVTGAAHASAEHAGSGLVAGTRGHAVGVAGTGATRDLYFCSGRCAPLVDQLTAIVAVLPKNHPERAIFEDLLRRARSASRGIKRGTLTPEAADAAQAELTRDLTRHSNASETFAALMNTDSQLLAQHRAAIRRRLGHDLDVATTHAQSQAETQAANRGSGRGRDPLEEVEPRSPIETDLLGGIDINVVDRPGRRQQPIHFDTGVFSHTYAEALVPGLPRGLDAEVRITFPDGSVGRADRVRFILDAEGDVIGAHVFEIKPNVGDNVARGQDQVQRYVSGIRAQIEEALRGKRKAIPTAAPDGGPLYRGQVMTYDFDQMVAVLRALRGSRRDAARMAELEGIARKVFSGELAGGVTGPPVGAGQATSSAGRGGVP